MEGEEVMARNGPEKCHSYLQQGPSEMLRSQVTRSQEGMCCQDATESASWSTEDKNSKEVELDYHLKAAGKGPIVRQRLRLSLWRLSHRSGALPEPGRACHLRKAGHPVLSIPGTQKMWPQSHPHPSSDSNPDAALTAKSHRTEDVLL